MSRMRTELQSWEELYAQEIAQFDAIEQGADELVEDFGVVHEPYEELVCSSRGRECDTHRWELDPASSDDWSDRAHRRGNLAQRWRHFGH